jgi:hypothetical protein
MKRIGTVGFIALFLFMFGFAGTALAAAPDNDDIDNPRVVDVLPYADGPYDTTEAKTGATDPPFCFDPSGGPDRATVWYEFTPVSDERYFADTFGSDYDTTLYVGTLNAAGGIDVIGCNDDSVDLQSAVAWDAAGGTTYLIMVGTCCGGGVVDETGGGGGSLTFHLDLAPPAPTIDLTIDARGSFTKAGAAIIRGTIACTGLNEFVIEDTTGGMISVFASQRVGRRIISGDGSGFEGPCPPTPTAWEITVVSSGGKFGGGAAQVDVFANGCGPIECIEVSASRTVQLKH